MSDRATVDATSRQPTSSSPPAATTLPPPEETWQPLAGPSSEELLDSLVFAYRPTWNLRHNAVTTYECVPTLPGEDGKRRIGDEIPDVHAPTIAPGLDVRTLERAAGDLRGLLATSQKAMMVIPVHFETLGTIARRSEYLARCRTFLPPDSAKYVAFELLDVPAGIVMNRFHEVTTPLRSSGRALLVRLPSNRTPFPSARESGVAAIGYECRAVAGAEAREIEDMQRFAALAQRAGVSSFLYGVSSLSLASAAIAAGVGFVNGVAIAPLIDAPRAIYNFDVAGLYAQRLGPLSGL